MCVSSAPFPFSPTWMVSISIFPLFLFCTGFHNSRLVLFRVISCESFSARKTYRFQLICLAFRNNIYSNAFKRFFHSEIRSKDGTNWLRSYFHFTERIFSSFIHHREKNARKTIRRVIISTYSYVVCYRCRDMLEMKNCLCNRVRV